MQIGGEGGEGGEGMKSTAIRVFVFGSIPCVTCTEDLLGNPGSFNGLLLGSPGSFISCCGLIFSSSGLIFGVVALYFVWRPGVGA